MKFFTPTALLAAALFSGVVVIPFLPAAKNAADVFVLEVTLRASSVGTAQLYYDDGGGFTETESSRTGVSQAGAPIVCRLPLPPGRYINLRFDPLDRDGTVTLHRLRIADREGKGLREIALSALHPLNQIQSLREHDGQLDVVITPGGSDPQLGMTFDPPLNVSAAWTTLSTGLLPRALPLFAGLAALLLAIDLSPRLREHCRRMGVLATLHPRRAVAVVATFAVVASAYPVVFLGKSFVSPNLGTSLLYDTFPTLPGYHEPAIVDVKGSDVGAIMWQHVPFSMLQHRALAQGELPLWNRYNALGVPLLAQGQSMFGDPLHLFVVLANGAAWAWDVKYLIAKWLFATGLGLLVLVLARSPLAPPSVSLGANAALLPALVVALAAPFVGFFYHRLNHPAFFSMCYAPWSLYCWLRVAGASDRRATTLWAAGLVVANLALMNSGTVKEAYMLLLCLNFSGACVLLASDAPWRSRLARLAALGWAGVIFVLLTAPIWATFLNTLKNSYTGYNAASAFQIQPGLLLGAFDEIFYRPIMAEERTFNPSANFLILLGLLYFLATLRQSFAHRAAMALAASALVPLTVAFGLVSPQWIGRMPLLANIAHLDNTFTCVLIVLWTVLAGVGFAQAAARLGTRDGRGDLAIAGLLLFTLVFLWVGFRQAGHRAIFGAGTTFSPFPPGTGVRASAFVRGDLTALLAASIILAVTLRRVLVRRRATPAAILVLAVCTVVLLWRNGLHAASAGFENYVARPTTRVNFHARSEAMEFVRHAQATAPARGYGFHSNFFPGWTGAYGLETIHGPDALVNPFVRELVGGLPGVLRIWDWRLYVDPQDAGTARPYLDALNVRYYFDQLSDQALLGRTLKLLKAADLDVYESPTAWPRAFFTDRLAVYDQAADYVRQIGSGDGRPFAAAQRSDLPAQPALAALPRDLASRTVVPAARYHQSENAISFDVHATGPGVIVLEEAFWPGDFRAEANGSKAPIVRLNHAFKGVVVEAAGEYHVSFRYWPKNFPRNLTLCGLGVFLLCGSLVLALRPARNVTPAPAAAA